MKRVFLRAGAVLLAAVFLMPALSCTKKAPKKETPAVSPQHEKMVEEVKKGVEESKKLFVARVNGSDITMHLLVQEMNVVAQKYVKDPKAITPEISEKIKREALDRLIFQELAIQEARKQGMKVSPATIDEVVKKVKAGLGSEEEFKSYLEKTGLNNEDAMKKQIERGHLFEMITAKEIFQKVKVDDKRVRDEYAKEKKNLNVPERYAVEDVLFVGGKDDEATMNKAKEVRALLQKENNDFSKLPKDNAYVVRKGMVYEQAFPALFNAASRLKTGVPSEPVKERDGIHVFRVLVHEAAKQMTFEEAQKMLERKLTMPLAEKRKEAWEAELKKNAKIEIHLDEVEKELKEKSAKKGK